MAAISLRGVSSVPREDGFAVRDIDLDVPDGVVCTLIGPSGSGKTTLLRLVAGLEQVSSGVVALGGVDATRAPPGDRDLAWCPQENPLYPHLDVEHNLGFALKLRRMFRDDRDERVHAEARATGVERLLRRMPHTLSAGEQQAAGIARATVRVPGAFLLDEPLARIDAQQRSRLRAELARIFHGVQVPVLLATNDQVEALALGDHIAVLRAGRLVQHGPKREVHDRPATAFVATFLGDPGMNVLPGTLEAGRRATFVRLAAGAVPLEGLPPGLRSRLDGTPVLLGVRPQDLRLGGEDAPLAAAVERVDLLGAMSIVHARLEGMAEPVALRVSESGRLTAGQPVRIAVRRGHAHLFDPVTELALWHAGDPT